MNACEAAQVALLLRRPRYARWAVAIDWSGCGCWPETAVRLFTAPRQNPDAVGESTGQIDRSAFGNLPDKYLTWTYCPPDQAQYRRHVRLVDALAELLDRADRMDRVPTGKRDYCQAPDCPAACAPADHERRRRCRRARERCLT